MTDRLLSLLLAALVAAPLAAAGAQTAPPRRSAPAPAARPFAAADRIAAAQLREWVEVIASDEMEGRDTPSPGLDRTAEFIAGHLSRWGLRPAGDDGTFFQKIALRRSEVDAEQTRAEVNGQPFAHGGGFLAGATPGTAAGSLVYAGHGWLVRGRQIDALAGLNVRDRIVIVAGGMPAGVTRADLRGKQGEEWDDAEGYARRSGAKGLIRIPDFSAAARWGIPRRRPPVVVERFQPAAEGALPTITASLAMVEALFRGEPRSGPQVFAGAITGDPGAPFELRPSKKASFTVGIRSEQLWTRNVVGVVEGSDPALKAEYVAFGAHYDHVGMNPEGTGDRIWNGADDDASGTAALMAMAEAAARGPRPRRSLLFIWHAGEERGLWGSRYFTEYPTVPLRSIVAQLNVDMIGRSRAEGDTKPANRELSGPDEIYVIGSRMMSDDLAAASEAVNGSYLKLKFNYRYDDPKDPNRFFFRSDHYHYARKGIPIIFYFNGVHEDYHRPSDTAEKLDYRKLERVTRTILATGLRLANQSQRPRVVRPLPAELAGD